MAYDEGLADRIRDQAGDDPAVSERKMFGGVCFMYGGNMYAGVVGSDLMVRVGVETFDELAQRPGARPMDFTGRPMKGMLYVDATAIAGDADLKDWLDHARRFAASLPAKQPGEKKPRRRATR